jgi:hypothetical protein
LHATKSIKITESTHEQTRNARKPIASVGALQKQRVMSDELAPGPDRTRRAGPFVVSANPDTAMAGLKVTKVRAAAGANPQHASQGVVSGSGIGD